MFVGTCLSSPTAITFGNASSRYASGQEHLDYCKLWWNTVSPDISKEAYEIYICTNNPFTTLLFAIKFNVARSIDMFIEPTGGANSMSLPYIYHLTGSGASVGHPSNSVYTGSKFRLGTTYYATGDEWFAAAKVSHPLGFKYVHVPSGGGDEDEGAATELGEIVSKILAGEPLQELVESNKEAFGLYAENLLQIYQYAATES